ISGLRKVIPHQANLRIIRAVQESLGLPEEKVFVNVDRCANTGSVSVAIALAEFLAKETVQPGDNLLLATFGGGLTWAASLVSWGDAEAIVCRRERERLGGSRGAADGQERAAFEESPLLVC